MSRVISPVTSPFSRLLRQAEDTAGLFFIADPARQLLLLLFLEIFY